MRLLWNSLELKQKKKIHFSKMNKFGIDVPFEYVY